MKPTEGPMLSEKGVCPSMQWWTDRDAKCLKTTVLWNMFILLFSIGHVYGCARLLHWVYVSERVRMRASFLDSILVYILGESTSHPFDFYESGEWPFFSISGSLFYPSFHLFRMWLLSMLWCRLTITHFSIFASSSILILFLRLTLPHRISLFLILLDVRHGFSIHTLFLFIRRDHSFITIFRVGTPRSGTHDVFYALHLMHEGYGDYIIGIFEPSFPSFLSPYYLSLRYVPCLKTTLRPLLHTLCLTAHTWAILELGRRLFLGAWWIGSWDDDLHWRILPLSVMDFHRRHYLHWGIPRSSMTFSFGMMLCTEA